MGKELCSSTKQMLGGLLSFALLMILVALALAARGSEPDLRHVIAVQKQTPTSSILGDREESVATKNEMVKENGVWVAPRYSKLARLSFPETIMAQDSLPFAETFDFIDGYSRKISKALKVSALEGFSWSPPDGDHDGTELRQRIVSIFRKSGYQITSNDIEIPRDDYWGTEFYDSFEARKDNMSLICCWASRPDNTEPLILFIGKAIPQSRQRVLDDELISAIEDGETGRVNEALQKGANPNARDYDDIPAINLAAMYYHAPVVHELLNKGARFTNQSIEPAIYAAIEDGQIEVVRELLKHGADPNGGNDWPYLTSAACHNMTDIMQLLIAQGAIVDKRMKDGTTALMQASSVYQPTSEPVAQVDAMEVLLRNGANPNMRDKTGQSAIFKALSTYDVRPIKLLLRYGANVNVADKTGKTPLIIVNRSQYPNRNQIVALLKNAAHKQFVNQRKS